MYANDEALSRNGGQGAFFEPPTRQEAFEAAFGEGGAAGAPVADSSRVPTLSANRNQAFVPGKSLRHHSQNMVFEPHELGTVDEKNAVALVTNPSGMEYIQRLAGRPPDEGGTSHVATHLSPANAAKLGDLAKVVARSAASEHLAGIARAAARAGKSLIVVMDHEGFSDEIKTTALNEELDHRLQSVLAGGGAAKSHLSEGGSQRFTQGTPPARTATAALGHYGFTASGEAASEIGVRLMRPGRYRELNLTFPEARSLGADYVRTLRKEHGSVPPREIAQRVFNALRRPDRRGGGEFDALSGSVRPPGGPGRRGGIEPDSSIRRQSSPEGRVGRPVSGELLPSVDAREPGLFDADTERQSQVDSQRDSDKLLGERLTAQFKSGLAAVMAAQVFQRVTVRPGPRLRRCTR